MEATARLERERDFGPRAELGGPYYSAPSSFVSEARERKGVQAGGHKIAERRKK